MITLFLVFLKQFFKVFIEFVTILFLLYMFVCLFVSLAPRQVVS